MVDPTVTAGNGTESAKNHFTKAVEQAKAGAQALAGEYKDKFSQTKDEWTSEAKVKSEEAKEKAGTFAADAKVKAAEYAVEGKAKASQAIVGLSKVIDDNSALIDEKVGAKYGDYARTASKSMQDAAARLDEKSLEDIGEEAREFVRKSPGLAIGIAAATGFVLARLFRGK
ncbi:hypothetical protein V474_09840 [Novosphingobium barchaimii LL02]|uniref:DUF883 domain-containing protein n=1 Tax=Novosphingobium barchaimii LL02 TaxID=1114963 RepID=A0A0J7Y6M9_9SPHN|nr:hypothetical protein [Novosphingobium barchaimii]KMS59491.1 hypothetical protein V474_09840 [Novosphingobium barchaimii LL02]